MNEVIRKWKNVSPEDITSKPNWEKDWRLVHSDVAKVYEEDWLEEIIKRIEEEKKRELSEFKREPARFSMNIEIGRENLGFRMNIGDLIDKFYTPFQLLGKAQEGINNLLSTLKDFEMDLKTNHIVKGLSGEYLVPLYLEDKNRQVIFNFAIFPCFLETFGIPATESYNVFAPFMTLDLFKYIDIMNAQEKPTIMAFYGIKNFSDITSVNFLEFIMHQLQIKEEPKEEELRESMKKEGIYGINLKNAFESYGVPKIDVKIKDALRMHILNPKNPENKRELIGYREELGISRFLNPSISDYSLYACYKRGEVEPEELGNFIEKGKLLGHYPSSSNLLPDITPRKAERDPFDLLEYLEQKGKTTEVRGKYKLTPEGQKLVEIEIYGKPSEITLRKIFNIIKNMKQLIPFLKFIF